MTQTDLTLSSGEERLRSRRNNFLRFCAIGMIVALGIGFVSGYTVDLVATGTLPPFTVYAFLALGLAGFCWFSYDYFRRVDELDLADNLWASLFGLYFYICALPCWTFLYDARLAPEPNNWAIYIATFAFTFIVYSIRKLGWR